MADDLTNRGAQDRSRINVDEKHEVRYWTQKWSVSEEQLAAAAKKVGVPVDAIARELGKGRPCSNGRLLSLLETRVGVVARH